MTRLLWFCVGRVVDVSVSVKPFEIPRIDYDKLIVAVTPVALARVRRVYPNIPYEVVNIRADPSSLVGTYAIEVDGTIHYVSDMRHGHGYDIDDNTTFSTTSSSYVTVLKIDYTSVINVKELYVRVGVWSGDSDYIAYILISYSTNDVNYTSIAEFSTRTTSESVFFAKSTNISLRYLKFDLRGTGGCAGYARAKKIIIIK